MAGKYSHYSEERSPSVWDVDSHRRGLRRSIREPGLDKVRTLPHFCKKGVMHTCGAKKEPDRQKNCHFYLKATGMTRCMDLTFDEYCTNYILHQYVAGGIGDRRATELMSLEKRRLSKIQKKAEGYTIDFPLEGEETIGDVQRVFDQLVQLGMTTPQFWMDASGKSADEYINFEITVEDVINGKWCPKRKELKKDILKYFDLRKKFGV